MAKKTEVKEDKIEREYVIPLRKEWNKVPRYKRANKAIKAIKEFLAKHFRVVDRDLNKIKIDKLLNEEVWFRGIKKPPGKIKVKARKEGDIVRVELAELPEKLKFKKAREEKAKEKATESAAKVKKKESHEGHEHKHEEEPKTASSESQSKEKTEEQKTEEKEKKAAVVESMEKIEKDTAKKQKHQTKLSKQPKHPVRQALQK
jgi:large subunit ribosomal protein L31e